MTNEEKKHIADIVKDSICSYYFDCKYKHLGYTVYRGTIDESHMAYKDTNEIKDLIAQICKVTFMMIPKINIKVADDKA